MAGDPVYLHTGGGTVSAVDSRTGDERWCFTLAANITAAPSTVDGTAYVGTTDAAEDGSSALYAIDSADGTQTWCARYDSRIAPAPTVVNGFVYVAGVGDGSALAALGARTGSELCGFGGFLAAGRRRRHGVRRVREHPLRG